MPVNVRRFCTSFLLTLTICAANAAAQTPPQTPPAETQTAPQTLPVKAPSSAEIMRDRISKAKAFIAVRNYNAAIYELENIRRETSDPSVQAVTTVLLMNGYLEQGDYKRAQDLLTDSFTAQKANRPNAGEIYTAIAGQVVKGARNKVERYRALGLMVADRNLPLEALNDVERMRETLELVITQAKENGKDRAKAPAAMALLEEATTSRSAMARDDYDARRWTDEVADSREQLANSRSIITNAVDGSVSPGSVPVKTVAVNNPLPAGNSLPVNNQPANVPADSIAGQVPRERAVPAGPPSPTTEKAAEPVKNDESAKALVVPTAARTNAEPPKKEEPVRQTPVQAAPRENTTAVKQETTVPAEGSTAGPIEVGSLLAYATKQAPPSYPPAARTMRTTGVVRLEVTVDESGEVSGIQQATGPTLLQSAAKDAVRKWRFKPFVRDGRPVKATGFVSFNFSL